MTSDERVLVFGDDASASAEIAWGWINAQRWPGWRAEVITAAQPPVGPPVGEARARPHPWTPPTPRVAGPAAGFSAVEHLYAEADPRLALCERTVADLLVIGPRGKGVLKALSIGSTADYLLHHPPAPILIAHDERAARRVLIGVDGSPTARRAVGALVNLPWATDAEVIVLGVASDGHDTDIKAAGEEAAQVLAGAVGKVETRVAHGHLNATILSELDSTDPDLLVLGAAGNRGHGLRWLGSTARSMAHVSPVSVLIVPA